LTKYIYLDQNHWVNLAKTFAGKNDNYKEVAEKIIEKSESGEWIFPLSIIHFMETEARFDDRSRKELAKVMAGISRNYSIVPSIYTDVQELNNAVASLHGIPTVNIRDEVIKKDFLRAAGLDGENFEIKGTKNPEETEIIKQELIKKMKTVPLFEIFMSIPQNRERIEKSIKDMNSPIEEYELQRSHLMKMPQQYREKYFTANTFIASHGEKLVELFRRFGVAKEDFIPEEVFASPESTMEFLESTPSLDIRNKLTFDILTETSREFHRNDYKDICFLSTAVPYCDVVITEKLWAHYLTQRGIDKKYDTYISKDLNDLLQME
jgi:hypothetical protein